MIFSEQDTLPNGVTIPRLALGTWFLPNQQAAEAVKILCGRPSPLAGRLMWMDLLEQEYQIVPFWPGEFK